MDATYSYSKENTRPVTALFKDRDSAERAYQALHERGYDANEINLLMSDDTRKRYFSDGSMIQTELGSKAAEGAGIGGAIGGTLGAIAAAIAAIGTTVAIPGLGLIIAGPLAAAIAGAGAGSLTGGLVGGLVGWGIPEEHVRYYEKGIKDGGILIAVKPRSEEDARYFERDWNEVQEERVY